MYLDNQIKQHLSPLKSLFEQMMLLRGECFRNQEGRLTQRITLGDKSYFIKQHSGVGWKEIIKNLFQGRLPIISAKNEWRAIAKLNALNVQAAQVLGYGEQGINPAKKRSFILLEELTPTLSLEELTKDWQRQPPNFAFKRMLIEKVAQIASTIHEHGINHRDFYICHFLLDTHLGIKNITRDNLKLFLIDLHRAQCRQHTPERWVIKDLAGLYFSSKEIKLSKRDYFRFMKIYSNQSLNKVLRNQHIFWKRVRDRGEQLYSDHSNR